MSESPSAQQMAALLAQWTDWLAARTDAMLSLEDRVHGSGSDGDRADLATAFVARKIVDERLQAISRLAQHDRAEAAELASQPLVDELGQTVGRNLEDAAELVDAIVRRVESNVSSVENRSAAEVGLATRADSDLRVAERLARDLGSNVNRAAQLRSDLVARRDLARVASDAEALRRELEQTDAERHALFDNWTALEDRLAALGSAEASVHQLAERCRSKVVQAPMLAIPSVAAVGVLSPVDELKAMPWAAARAMMAPIFTKVQRIEAALNECNRRFQQPLDERDDLRGLLQSFRDKAGARGLAENADLDPLYHQAESLLWTAPCDVAAARPLVDRYVAAVNAKIASAVSPGGLGS